MPDNPLVLIAILLLGTCTTALMVLIVLRPVRLRRRRSEAMAALAGDRGWRFTAAAPDAVARFPGAPFSGGYSRRTANLLEGEVGGRPFVAVDFSRSVPGGDHSRTQHFSVVALHLGRLAQPVPMLQVASRGGVGATLRGLVGAEIPTGDPTFDAMLQVTGASPELARDLLDADLRVALFHHRFRTWRFQGEWLVSFRSGQHDAEEVDGALAAAAHLVDLVPAPVWDRLGRVG
jgi:hypothetical protein